MPHDLLDLPRLDPGTPTMGQLLHEREWPTAGISLPSLIGDCAVSEKWEIPMNEETLNLSIRKFLKTVGINSQREIEHAVANAAAAGAIAGTESFSAKMTLEITGLKLKVEFGGDITLQ
jgi:Family of unknown function (DUF6494)